MPELIINIIVFIFGATIGSFLNVCIYRMPEGESVVWPGSHCPNCKKRIAPHDNIPFMSFILLKGKCRLCQKPISFVYFLVELITAAMFVILFNKFGGLSYEFLFYAFFVCGLIVASFIDLKHRIIPDEISVGGLIMGLVLSATRGVNLTPFSYNPHFLWSSLLGAVTGGGIIYLTGTLFDLIYFKLLKRPPIQGETESIGGGDVKLLAMIGAFLGWKGAVLSFLLAPFLGLSLGIFNLVTKKDHTIPYGPFLALAALLALFWSDEIISLFFIK